MFVEILRSCVEATVHGRVATAETKEDLLRVSSLFSALQRHEEPAWWKEIEECGGHQDGMITLQYHQLGDKAFLSGFDEHLLKSARSHI